MLGDEKVAVARFQIAFFVWLSTQQNRNISAAPGGLSSPRSKQYRCCMDGTVSFTTCNIQLSKRRHIIITTFLLPLDRPPTSLPQPSSRYGGKSFVTGQHPSSTIDNQARVLTYLASSTCGGVSEVCFSSSFSDSLSSPPFSPATFTTSP